MDERIGGACTEGPRWSDISDSAGLADIHRETWRYAYAGIIPGVGLERMISRRGAGWWRRLHAAGGRALVVGEPDALVAYALVGRNRTGQGGEIQELYVRPAWQGLGVGGRLFAASRRELDRRGVKALTVWCLTENRIGCDFYRSRGGVESGRAHERVVGATLEKRRFSWT